MSKSRVLITIIVGIAAFQWFKKRGDDGLGSDAVITNTPANMEAKLFQSSQPVLAYFWAPW
jgi:thioredoxin-like negative regulator of GroEL